MTGGTKARKRLPAKDLSSNRRVVPPVRERVLTAAFAAFTEHGYEGASTLEIASRANVSKRELYALFDNKQGMLAACIAERAQRMRAPLQLPAVRDREALAMVLKNFGKAILGEVSHPKVLAVYRLAIAEAKRAPAVAKALDTFGRKASRTALAEVLSEAQSLGLVGSAEPSEMATQFFALLWGDLLMQLLLGLSAPPTADLIERRAHHATQELLRLHCEPKR